ncbi:hypothetical protein LMG3410_06258 [Achromobacter aegrifaciens]|nr:hypothetical protein LMG3410_06258 [Achromobacter aegrifaciens]
MGSYVFFQIQPALSMDEAAPSPAYSASIFASFTNLLQF